MTESMLIDTELLFANGYWVTRVVNSSCARQCDIQWLYASRTHIRALLITSSA